jgi:hypothetical protein
MVGREVEKGVWTGVLRLTVEAAMAISCMSFNELQ